MIQCQVIEKMITAYIMWYKNFILIFLKQKLVLKYLFCFISVLYTLKIARDLIEMHSDSYNHTKLMKDIEISYQENWRKSHWKSIESAYKSSPYFEFYEDKFRVLYQQEEKYLLDFIHKIIIFELNMPLDEGIKEWLKEEKYERVINIFKKRDIYNQLKK